MTQPVATDYLKEIMRDANARTIELVRELNAEQLIGPKLEIVNPLRWEIGHVAWFHEYFILRRKYGRETLHKRSDKVYDSIAIHHETRWDLPLLEMDETLQYITDVEHALLDRLHGGMASEQDSYLYQFTTFHQDMHNEAYTYSRQTLGFPTPNFALAEAENAPGGAYPGDAKIPGGTFNIGNPKDAPFVFDNEKWAHPLTVGPFKMAKAQVSNAEFAAFTDDGGYEEERFWDDVSWQWRSQADITHPVYWLPDGHGKWGLRRLDTVIYLPPDQAMIHVSWFEAQAYCRWAGRRLPTEAEWEFAATTDGQGGKRAYPWGDETPDAAHANLDGRALGTIDVGARPAGDNIHGVRQLIGNVWEWTETTFRPFPGFAPDDYKEYSEPLFGATKVLRGGAWPTRGRMIDSTYRNFYGPERRDVLAGFRTCAL